jgi:putative MATE family efflux protein
MNHRIKIYRILLTLKIFRNLKLKEIAYSIKEAIIGAERDYTQGSIRKAIFILSVPMILEMVMESIFAIVDIFFVSKLGADAVATVGLTESILTLVYAIAFGLSMATTAMISRRIGEKKPKEASHIAFQAILTGLLISAVISVCGIIFASRILELMGANQRIVSEMSDFTAIMLGGNTVIMLLFIINAVFRSAGDAAVSMRVLWLGNIINIILDPLLIFGIWIFPEMGVTGAAVATTTGRGIAVIYQIFLLFNGKQKIRLKLRNLRVDLSIIGKIIKLSLGNIGQNIIATSSWVILMRIMSVFGSSVIAGYTIAIRIIIFALLPSWGLSNAASTLVGQNLGAGQPERAEKSAWIAGKINIFLMGIIGLIFIIEPGFFIRLFINDEAVISIGIDGLRIISLGFIFYGLGMVLINSINGAGDTITPIYLNLLCFWLIEIPLAYLMAISLGAEEKGVFFAIIIAESLLTILAYLWFRKGIWKSVKV